MMSLSDNRREAFISFRLNALKLTRDYTMADFQAKICEKFNINSLTDNQSKSITAIIDGKDVFVGTKTGSAKRVLIGCSYH
jgi:superfamily II DNA/RNA helicase